MNSRGPDNANLMLSPITGHPLEPGGTFVFDFSKIKKRRNRDATIITNDNVYVVVWFKRLRLGGAGLRYRGDMAMLSQFKEKADPLVTFGDNNKCFTMGYGKLISVNIIIEDVTLVAGLEVNLLSVSQFADKGFKVSFDKGECTFINKKTGEVALKGARKENLFVADLDSSNEDGICCFYIKASVDQSKI
ncbi:hypothetical protein AgCh_026601 [Apium graveolens]